MAVYREGYSIVEKIQRAPKQIWGDSADYGVLVKKGDENFNAMKQFVEWYGVEGTRVQSNYSTGTSVAQHVQLMDEWAVSDQRKTVAEATDMYNAEYVTISDPKLLKQGYIGIVSINEL